MATCIIQAIILATSSDTSSLDTSSVNTSTVVDTHVCSSLNPISMIQLESKLQASRIAPELRTHSSSYKEVVPF